MRLSCPHYLDALVASGQSHVEVSENYDAVRLASSMLKKFFEWSVSNIDSWIEAATHD
jgi:hypothetical protein